VNPRIAAHTILVESRTGTFADHVAERVLPEVPAQDRGLALEIAYGCLRLRGRLDTRIAALTDRPLKRIDPGVLDWLRSGVYEITELRTPSHAAVYETVKQSRRTGDGGAAGFINAVLRAASAGPPDPFPAREEDLVGHLTTYGSHPEWLVRRWVERWSERDVASLVEHGNKRPPVVLRMLGAKVEEALAEAVAAGIVVSPLNGWRGSYLLERGTPAEALAVLPAVIQDPAASAVVDYLGDGFSSPVYDACAAPGTKAMGLAARASGVVVAADVSARRVARIGSAAGRLGFEVSSIVADGRYPAVASAGTVLADVPCTGTGVLRRRPDARWRIDAKGLEDLVSLQRQILNACAEIVEEGGRLVYSTCSLEPEENEMQIARFLRLHPGFERERPTAVELPEGVVTAVGDLFVRPWIHGTDGAYAARLRRVH
jgi:16S rRNA (cytosine967-C5)-methyltransferase